MVKAMDCLILSGFVKIKRCADFEGLMFSSLCNSDFAKGRIYLLSCCVFQVAIKALMRVLRDPTLSSYHHKVVGSLMYILKVVLPSLLFTLVCLILWQSIVTSVYDGPTLFAEIMCFYDDIHVISGSTKQMSMFSALGISLLFLSMVVYVFAVYGTWLRSLSTQGSSGLFSMTCIYYVIFFCFIFQDHLNQIVHF